MSPLILIIGSATGELSSMWRIELLHPAVVHFPVALTVVGSLFWILGRFGKLGYFRIPAALLLVFAALGAWLGVQTGFWADAEVGRELYDPRPLKDHENLSLAFAWLMSAIALVEILCLTVIRHARALKAMNLLLGLALVLAFGLVGFTAHLGAGLVYQQGAGVEMPSSEP
jgi:uncharacterized membrane protein